MTHHARAEVVKARDERKDHDPRKQRDLVGDRRQGGMDGFLKPGGLFVVHLSLGSGVGWGDLYFKLIVLTSLRVISN